MYISQNSWHFQLYKFTKIVVERFRGNPYWDSVSTSRAINLCPYMRTILIWGPIVLGLYALMYAFAFYVLLYLPITMTNGAALAGTGIFILFCAVCGGAMLGMFMLITKLTVGITDKRREHLERLEAQGIKPSGFFVIFKEYLKSLKSKTCVQLEIQ